MDPVQKMKKSHNLQNETGERDVSREEDLSSFREQWQNEIRSTKQSQTDEQLKKVLKPTSSENVARHNADVQGPTQDEDINERATKLFLKGVEMENSGKLYEAIQYYKQAVQIVPDIEFIMHKKTKPKVKQENEEEELKENIETEDTSTDDDDDEDNEEDIFLRIQRKASKKISLCTPKHSKNGLHIGQMPVELILYILKWVVSDQLDMRSLEMFSSVCRGFYLCARNEGIWKVACLRVWGVNCGSTTGDYKSWRHMFIERPRVNFNGCYISKTTYIRNGENSFQDQFYRPWYLVAYYRFLRFYPDGTVLMLTSAEEPVQGIHLLKSRNAKYPVFTGYYRLKDDRVILVVQRQQKNAPTEFKKSYKKQDNSNKKEMVYNMEFQIKGKRKKHEQLHWTHYSIVTKSKKGDETTTNFDLLGNRYPALLFSRVKSFTESSENPLI
ncbi:F-box only protein 9 [Diabrotica virgifera virgifera]|nr:F-box only protein 9 [Diabrotica virgifera virgifera]